MTAKSLPQVGGMSAGTGTVSGMPSRPRFTVAERIQGFVSPLLGRLPASVLYKMSGEPPIVMEGMTLDPQMQFIRSFQRKKRPFYRYCEPTVAAARVRLRREALMCVRTPTPVGAVRDFMIPGVVGEIPVRHYAPVVRGATRGVSDASDVSRGAVRDAVRTDAQPLLVFFHGGGFAVGDVEMYDEVCRILCAEAGMHVLSVEYRLAPEHPFPAGLHDAQAAFRWAREHAGSLGADVTRVMVGGDSAGGNFAAVVSQVMVREGKAPFAQLLIYPTVDGGTTRRSHELYGDGFFLDEKDRVDFTKFYVGETPSVTVDNPLLAPLHASDLRGLPPALVITAGFDILRDEAEAYVEALRTAGNVVRWERFSEFGHAFINMTAACPSARRAMVKVARDFRAFVDGVTT